MEIRHFSHQQHPLLIRDNDKIISDRRCFCGICSCSIELPCTYYICEACKYYVHKSCAELPRQISLPFHPSHPLTLATNSDFPCACCFRHFVKTGSFGCAECQIYIDVVCAQMMLNSITTPCPEGQHCIQHSSHPHSLLLIDRDVKKDFQIECCVCNNKIQRSPPDVEVYYGCTRCEFFLHKECLDKYPQQTLHPLHSCHGLLGLRAKIFITCSLCDYGGDSYWTLYFQCPKCDFHLCKKCGSTMKSNNIKYEDHEHLLCFVDKIHSQNIKKCNGHDTYCNLPVVSNSSELCGTLSSLFRCFDCNFKVHLLCGPLPSTIKHNCHIHPLILVDSLIEDNSGEYYCDVCETKRDPRIRIYYCEPCKYKAHVACVASEIINVLNGDLKDVKLKTLGQDLWLQRQDNQGIMSCLTLKDVLYKIDKKERDLLLMTHVQCDDTSFLEDTQQEDSDSTTEFDDELSEKDLNRILKLSRFTMDDFEEFVSTELEEFCDENKLKLTCCDLELKMVDVKGYMIPYTLAPVFETLLNMYGDISTRNEHHLSQEYKSIVYFFLCRVIKGMCNTMVIDVTINHLQEWSLHLIFVDHKGFRIDFAWSQLVRLIQAFFGLQSNMLQDEIPTILNRKISELLNEKLKELQRGLEICKEYRGSSPKSEIMKDCLNVASKLKWKKACEGLILLKSESMRE